ncbi:MAG: hypothetical protein EAZ06_00205 [Cytophagales bacterium]|nr:MAG: hypothetical protein EAY69_06800 [Cytophagales bacterium]TAH31509.1 MAG: hypothetical protein EAZ06_00205 [Cytophagales bacterium]
MQFNLKINTIKKNIPQITIKIMFLNILEKKEKEAYFALAKRLINADNQIMHQEDVLMRAMQQEMQWDVEKLLHLSDNLSIKELCDVFVEKRTRVCAIMELIGIAFVDGEFVNAEQELIYEIGECMQMDKEEINMYIDWAKRVYGG